MQIRSKLHFEQLDLNSWLIHWVIIIMSLCMNEIYHMEQLTLSSHIKLVAGTKKRNKIQTHPWITLITCSWRLSINRPCPSWLVVILHMKLSNIYDHLLWQEELVNQIFILPLVTLKSCCPDICSRLALSWSIESMHMLHPVKFYCSVYTIKLLRCVFCVLIIYSQDCKSFFHAKITGYTISECISSYAQSP